MSGALCTIRMRVNGVLVFCKNVGPHTAHDMDFPPESRSNLHATCHECAQPMEYGPFKINGEVCWMHADESADHEAVLMRMCPLPGEPVYWRDVWWNRLSVWGETYAPLEQRRKDERVQWSDMHGAKQART